MCGLCWSLISIVTLDTCISPDVSFSPVKKVSRSLYVVKCITAGSFFEESLNLFCSIILFCKRLQLLLQCILCCLLLNTRKFYKNLCYLKKKKIFVSHLNPSANKFILFRPYAVHVKVFFILNTKFLKFSDLVSLTWFLLVLLLPLWMLLF